MPRPVALAGGRWLKLPLPTLQPSSTIMTAGSWHVQLFVWAAWLQAGYSGSS